MQEYNTCACNTGEPHSNLLDKREWSYVYKAMALESLCLLSFSSPDVVMRHQRMPAHGVNDQMGINELILFWLCTSQRIDHTCLATHRHPTPSLPREHFIINEKPNNHSDLATHSPKHSISRWIMCVRWSKEVLLIRQAMGVAGFGVAGALEMIKDMANVISH